ncbi:GTP-binding protein RAD-like [Mya arenaria]|uniref:GTP-binding protein RAD-like n=1 Tax=Mya arenaria TaxID=6604 RepID=UPI0022E7A49F|nr:GTP-binding protein RAD-like [Mya arenaria]
MNFGTAQIMLRLPDDSNGPVGKHRCPSPLLGSSNNLNIMPMNRKRASSFKKPREKNLDMFLSNDMRPRTSSMPSRNAFKRSHEQLLQKTLLGLNIEPELETYTVREFEMNSKGVIVHRSDSMRSRSTNSVMSSEGDFCPISPTSRTSSSLSRDSVAPSPVPSAPPARVLVTGIVGCGKTAITQQFMTSEYLGGFNTSIDGETEKVVNVLLNGEETSLAFIEHTTQDDTGHSLKELGENITAFLIVYACDDKDSFDRAVDMLYTLRKKQHNEEIIIFVGNKSDLVRSRCVSSDEAKAVAKTYGCKFIETSVVLNVNVDELLVGIVKQLRLRDDLKSKREKVSPGCASSSKSLLSKIFKKEPISKSCENLYTL